MATITIRNLDEKVKRRLQVRAALNGRSMEAEARDLLTGVVEKSPAVGLSEFTAPEEDLGTAIHNLFAPFGGVELQIPPRNSPNRQDQQPTQNPSREEALKKGLGTAIHELFAPLGGVELEIPPRRKSHRQIPTFE